MRTHGIKICQACLKETKITNKAKQWCQPCSTAYYNERAKQRRTSYSNRTKTRRRKPLLPGYEGPINGVYKWGQPVYLLPKK